MRRCHSSANEYCGKINNKLVLLRRPETVLVSAGRTFLLAAVVFLGSFCACAVAGAQAPPAARQIPLELSVGAGFSVFNTDWARSDMTGITALADATYHLHYGIELEGRTIQFNQFQNLREDTIAGGPRYVFSAGKFRPFAKGLIGIGSIDFPDSSLPSYKHDTFAIYEIGAGSDYKLTDKLALRAQWDFQFWPGWAPHGLTPRGATIGLVWRFR